MISEYLVFQPLSLQYLSTQPIDKMRMTPIEALIHKECFANRNKTACERICLWSLSQRRAGDIRIL